MHCEACGDLFADGTEAFEGDGLAGDEVSGRKEEREGG